MEANTYAFHYGELTWDEVNDFSYFFLKKI